MLNRLREQLAELRYLRGPTLAVLVVGCIGGIGLGRVVTGSASSAHAEREAATPQRVVDLDKAPKSSRKLRQDPTPQAETTPPPAANAPEAMRLKAALQRGVADATRRYPGTAEAAAWIVGEDAPVSVGDIQTPHRMWSMSKAVTAVALEDHAAGAPLSPLSQEALTDAITRSDNCAQRAVIVNLQTLVGGTRGAMTALNEVLGMAGAQFEKLPQTGRLSEGDVQCIPYVQKHARTATGTAPLLGTAEWNLLDAIHFAHALADGTYGPSGAAVLKLMSQPKLRPLITTPTDLTVPLDWGAGRVFKDLNPAYKGGWGGSLQDQYMAGQIVVVDIGGQRVALAAIYHPTHQPDGDDPGKTNSDKALEAMFSAARDGLE